MPLSALLAFAAAFLAVVLGESFRWGGPANVRWWADSGWTLSGGLATGACIWTAWRQRDNSRLVWSLFAFACALWTAGQCAWDYYDFFASFPPAPSLADVGYLAFAPPFAAGMLAIGRGTRRSRLLLALDIGVMLVGFAILFMALFWSHLRHSTLSGTAQTTAMMYPVVYATLASTVLIVPLRRTWYDNSLRFLLLGLAGQTISFILWTPLLLDGTYVEGTPLDVIWMVGMLFIAASALCFEGFPMVDVERQVHGAIAFVPLGLTILAVLARLWLHLTLSVGGRMEQVLVNLIAAMVILTAGRLALTLHSSKRLFDRADTSRREAEATASALRESEERFRATFDRAAVGIAHTALDGRWLMINQHLLDFYGYTQDEITDLRFQDITHPDDLAADLAQLKQLLAGEIQSYGLEKRYIHKDGSLLWAHVTISLVRDETGAPKYTIAVVKDIGARKRAEEELRMQKALLESQSEASIDGILVTSMEGKVVSHNRRFVELWRLKGVPVKGEWGSKPVRIMCDQLVDPDGFMQRIRYLHHHPDEESHEEILLKDGRVFDRYTAPIKSGRGYSYGRVWYFRDITERKRAEEQLAHQALHDALTGLPNRTLLRDRLQQAILVARRDRSSLALLLMDLNRFKDVNDTFGHHCGDLLLQQLSLRLQAALRDSDTVARLGGDEFAVVLPGADEIGACRIARKIATALDEPFEVEGRVFDVGVSIGCALYPDHGEDATSLMRRADVAMYVAKRTEAGYMTYTHDQDEHSPARLALMSDLRAATAGDQLSLHYQPEVNLKSGRAEQVEALARWRHPERGFVPPDTFISLAEETGLIKPLTKWVLNEALRQRAAWQTSGLDSRVAVNLSARSLHDPELVDTIADLLRMWEVSAACLEVEITESAIIVDPDRAMQTLTRLHEMGVWISIDDFGTGYSSLAHLKRLPVDRIKIDRSFVMDMTENADNAFIVRSIIDLSHNLGLKVVAEGVENQETLDMLVAMDCDVAQGYYLSKPLPTLEMTAWFSRPKLRILSAS